MPRVQRRTTQQVARTNMIEQAQARQSRNRPRQAKCVVDVDPRTNPFPRPVRRRQIHPVAAENLRAGRPVLRQRVLRMNALLVYFPMVGKAFSASVGVCLNSALPRAKLNRLARPRALRKTGQAGPAGVWIRLNPIFRRAVLIGLAQPRAFGETGQANPAGERIRLSPVFRRAVLICLARPRAFGETGQAAAAGESVRLKSVLRRAVHSFPAHSFVVLRVIGQADSAFRIPIHPFKFRARPTRRKRIARNRLARIRAKRNHIPTIGKTLTYSRRQFRPNIVTFKSAVVIIEIASGVLHAIVINGQIAKISDIAIPVKNIGERNARRSCAMTAKIPDDVRGNRRSRVRKIRVGDSALGEGGGGEEVGEGEVLRLDAFGLEPDGEGAGEGGRQQDEAEDSAGGGRNATTDSEGGGGGGASTASAIRLPQNGRNCKRRRRRIGGRLRGFGRGRSWVWVGSDGSALRGLVGCGISGDSRGWFRGNWEGFRGEYNKFPLSRQNGRKKIPPKKNHCHRRIFLRVGRGFRIRRRIWR